MGKCSGKVNTFGRAHANKPEVAYHRAFKHLYSNGDQECTQNTCDSGRCVFTLSGAQVEALHITYTPDADGNGTTCNITGQGSCHCE
jgi:hypothetical protein